MATKKTKTLMDVTTVTTVNNDQYIPLADASGKVTKITLANLKASILGGMSLDAITEGIGIVYHRNSSGALYAVHPERWKVLQEGGEIAEGVLVVEGGKSLVVAPTEAKGIPWSSAAVSGGGKATSNSITALEDWAGKANTAAQIEHAECQGESYAPGFCNLYGITNSNSVGMSAGKWWLPSVGEMMMIASNANKINYALSSINGATTLSEIYWTSTERDTTIGWLVGIEDLGVREYNKIKSLQSVRPVTAYA